ncbi:MAG: hypothetical protein GOVbin4162_126 [Prokaryotic dsDNA virus sp.]|nr:MAG: hypothetical protein GOVbin4162_126 [Prokaryotic dsDNA virus sp.]|tara:strand:- start:2971 stop:3303 length:333 start_codon:yes stop_codon:yes gene_type:complete
MTVRAFTLGHPIHYEDGYWILTETGEKLWTPLLASGGQRLRCRECLKFPTPEGHDGCLGTLVNDGDKEIMNACCGHGDSRLAYIQYTDKTDVREEEAIKEQKRLLCLSQS